MRGLAGKVAFVSGAGSGIGLATATRLADEQCHVVAGIYDESQRAALGALEGVLLDVASEASWAAAIKHTLARHGGLDILVNSAGVGIYGTIEETTPEMWNTALSVNLAGTMYGCREAVPLMRRRGGGAIVNVASINAIRGNHKLAAYSASKAGIYGLTMQMALDYAPENIRVNCVCPAAIETPMTSAALKSADPATIAAMVAKHPMARFGRADEVASTIAFLASGDASFITGLAIPVDGGRSIR